MGDLDKHVFLIGDLIPPLPIPTNKIKGVGGERGEGGRNLDI